MSTQEDADHRRFGEFVDLYAADGYVPATNETLVSVGTLRSIAAAMSAKYASAQMWQVYQSEGLVPKFKEGPCENNRAEFLADTECCVYIDRGASSDGRHFGARFGLAWWLLHRRGEPFTETDVVFLAALLVDERADVGLSDDQQQSTASPEEPSRIHSRVEGPVVRSSIESKRRRHRARTA